MVWRKFHSLIFEIRVDIQNDIFGDCVVDLLWCCHNETQTRNEARNCVFMIVLGAQKMYMHLGVYELKSQLSCNSFCVLRRSAANYKIFKLFFLHPFLASTIYNNTIKKKIDIG